MAARTVPSLRVLCTLVVLACLAAAALAPRASADGSDTTGTGPFGPFAGYSLDPLGPSQPDSVPTYKQPDWLQDPLFNTYFGSGMFDPASGKYVSVAIGPDAATGASRVYVASSTTKLVYVFNGQMPLSPPTPPQPLFTFGTQPGPGTLQGPAGIAYYRGELYVVDRYLANPGQDRVAVYDTAGNYEREFPLLNPRGLFNMTGVDVMGGEVWVTGDLCGGLGGVVEIFDATTGALKAILPHFGNDPIPDATQPCDESADPSSWWDISAVPEMNSAIAQYRLINRGLLAQLSLPDAELACPNCFNGLFEDGTGEVPGMRWFLAVDGDSTSRGTHISEYSIDSDPTSGEPFLRVRRRWTPQQATTGGVRDVAYQRRDTRIDWTGNLTQPDWQHNDASGHQCLQYVVSDGDIFTVGAKGEHSWDLANVQKIEFYLDGTLQATIANQATGTYCLDESVPPSGIHDLMAKAYVDNGATIVVTADNPNLHIDHDPPSGALDSLPKYVHAATAVAGSMTDAHSGPRDWQLQISPAGQGSWSSASGCSLQTKPDPTSGKYGCSLSTTAYADGQYDLRSMMRDNVQDPFGGPNLSYTSTRTVGIDNTPPTVTVSGDLWDARVLPPLHIGDPQGLHVDASDAGSGVKSIDIQVDGVTKDSVTQSCPNGACSMSHDWTFDATGYGEGQHTVKVVAKDQLDQQSNTSWTIDVEDAGEAPPNASSSTSSSSATVQSSADPPTVPGNVGLPDPTVVPDVPSTGTPADSLPCELSDTTNNFPVFSVGPNFEGLPVTDTIRRCDAPGQNGPDEGRADYVSYIYGDCTFDSLDPNVVDVPECTPPLEVQSWPACVRNLAQYAIGPDWATIDFTNITLNSGIPGASFDGGTRIEVYTGTSTVVIFGGDTSQVLRAANALVQEPTGTLQVIPEARANTPLAQPAAGALDGTLPCG